MNMFWKSFTPLIVFAFIAGLLAFGLRNDPSVLPSPLLERTMPAFTVSTLRNPEQALSEKDWIGRKALVNVWASWCVACREEHELLLALRDRGVLIYGLNYKDTREDALAWLSEFGDPYRLSAHDLDGRVGVDWGVYGVPETFVIDAAGVIRYKHVGVLTPEALDSVILPLFADLEDG